MTDLFLIVQAFNFPASTPSALWLGYDHASSLAGRDNILKYFLTGLLRDSTEEEEFLLRYCPDASGVGWKIHDAIVEDKVYGRSYWLARIASAVQY